MPAEKSVKSSGTVTDVKSAARRIADENSAQAGFVPADKETQPELDHAATTDAAEQILGANPLLGLDRDELLAAGKRLLRLMTVNPQVLIEENLGFVRELAAIAMGTSKILPDGRDRKSTRLNSSHMSISYAV